MPQTRRKFLGIAASGLAATAAMSTAARSAAVFVPTRGETKAILFDAFPIFDSRPIPALAESLYPEQGAELAKLWRIKLFEYNWLRAAAQRYADFWTVAQDALVCAARTLKIELGDDKWSRLMDSYMQLKAYPDVLPALKSFRDSGIRLGLLSNLTPKMLAAGIENSGLDGLFDQVLSTDAIGTYKPDPRAYQLGVEAFSMPDYGGLGREDIVFAAFAGWDAVGAKWFGYRTFWVNRSNQPREEFGIDVDGTGQAMADLANFVKASG